MPKTLKGEAGTKRAVEDLLKAERIRYIRTNAGDRFGQTNGRKWRIRGCAKGTPDFLAIPRIGIAEAFAIYGPGVVWIECKAPGKAPSPEQLQFADEARNNGEFWLCVDDVRQLAEWLKENRAR